MTQASRLPEPVCQLGYTSAQLLGILGAERAVRFHEWMQTRTYARCDRASDEDAARGSGPHGRVVPPSDLERFLKLDARC